MPNHRFDGVDVDFIGMVPKNIFNGKGLQPVVVGSGSPMSVDVVHIFRSYSRTFQSKRIALAIPSPLSSGAVMWKASQVAP